MSYSSVSLSGSGSQHRAQTGDHSVEGGSPCFSALIRSKHNVDQATSIGWRGGEFPSDQASKTIVDVGCCLCVGTHGVEDSTSLAVQRKVLGEGLADKHVDLGLCEETHSVSIFIHAIAQALIGDI